jgi:ribulose-5-phosphate 4-epimerase/fuculose-1-phosphate aldolase
MSPEEAALRETVIMAGKILYRLGLVDYMGHASARIPGTDRALIKPRHSEDVKGMDSVLPEQLVTMDLDGAMLDGPAPPPSERYIHTAIYRARPDVGGVVHTHQTLATTFGIVGRPILPILHVEAPLVADGVPIYESPRLITSAALGADVASALGSHDVCHLRNHGIVAVGRTVQEATVNAIFLERLARANLLASQLGTPAVISPEDVDALRGPMVGYQVRWAYYASLTEQSGPVNW